LTVLFKFIACVYALFYGLHMHSLMSDLKAH